MVLHVQRLHSALSARSRTLMASSVFVLWLACSPAPRARAIEGHPRMVPRVEMRVIAGRPTLPIASAARNSARTASGTAPHAPPMPAYNERR
jgi:hypothetical protein